MKKRILSFFAIVMFAFIFLPVLVFANGAENKIHDLAYLFSNDQRNKLEEKARQIVESNNIDIGVVTISNSKGKSSQDFADDYFDYNGFGTGKNKDGLLLLIDMDNRRIHVTTHAKAIKIFNDNAIERLLDAAYPHMKSKNHYEAAFAFLLAAEEKIPTKFEEVMNFLIPTLLIGVVSAGGILGILIFLHNNDLENPASEKIKTNSFNLKITLSNDKLTSSHIDQREIPREDSYSSSDRSSNSSSSRSGTSTHTSSSGQTHGGGGRSF